ncbi:MAG TPA: hypothetical protein VM779_05385 [Thermoanaerobaculia bacterium]|nr:hypothetical protein [Thermoanaerobaculia bacterium]
MSRARYTSPIPPSTVRNALVNNSTTGRLTSIGSGSPNRLVYTNY